MQPAKASVIIPVLNRRELLPRTLQSIVSQNYRPLEIIVVDNGSTDGTYEAARAFAEELSPKDDGLAVKVMRHSEPGASKARNAGFRHSAGEVVLFFDSDDLMCEGAVNAYMDAFEKNPDADIVVGNIECQLENGRRKKRKTRRGNIVLNHFHHCVLNTLSYASRRKFLQKAESLHKELWPSHLGVWDDWALGFRLLMSAPRIICLNSSVAVVRPRQHSITGEAYCMTVPERYLAAIADLEATALLHQNTNPGISASDYRKWKNLTLYRKVLLAGILAHESRSISEDTLKRSPYLDRKELMTESRRLYESALSEAKTKRIRRTLAFAYRYVSLGLRGCATFVTPFL